MSHRGHVKVKCGFLDDAASYKLLSVVCYTNTLYTFVVCSDIYREATLKIPIIIVVVVVVVIIIVHGRHISLPC